MKKVIVISILLSFFFINKVFSQWQPANNGLYGGFVTSVDMNLGLIVAGTQGGGVFLSTDNGKKWTPISIGLKDWYIKSILVHDHKIYTASASGMYFTKDDEIYWKSCSKNLDTVSFNCIIAENEKLFAGTRSGKVYWSRDNGKNWEQYGDDIGHEVFCLKVHFDKIYAGTFQGIFITPLGDESSSWEEFALNDNHSGITTLVKTLYAQDSIIWAGTNGMIFRSFDLGKNWTLKMTGLNGKGLQINHINLVETPTQGKIFYAATYFWGGGVYRSTDFGDSWEQINVGMADTNEYFSANYVGIFDGLLIAGTGQGIFRSSDYGDTWFQQNEGLTATFVTDIIKVNDKYIVSVNGIGILRSEDNCSNWQKINKGITNFGTDDLLFSGGNILASSPQGVFISKSEGDDWELTGTGYSNYLSTNNGKVYSGGYGVSISDDDGLNWYRNDGNKTRSIVTSMTNKEEKVFFGTDKGVYVSYNDCKDWDLVRAAPRGWITDLVVDNDKLFVLCVQQGIYLSYDAGETFTNISSDGIDENIRALTMKGDYLFAGTNYGQGIYLSHNLGEKWTLVNDGLPGTLIGINEIRIIDDMIFACTIGAGLYKAKLTDIIISGVEGEGSVFRPEIYPNPFSKTTAIKYILDKPDKIKIIVYDNLGKEIKILENNIIPAGEHRVVFDGDDLNSGIYYYSIQTSSNTECGKLVIIK